MSDSENAVKKRGRVAATAGDKRPASKKEDKPAVADGETVAKRGRGRPKGTTKKNGGFKKNAKKVAPVATGKGRGRPPAKKKEESTEEENEENDDTEGNDEENDSGSD